MLDTFWHRPINAQNYFGTIDGSLAILHYSLELWLTTYMSLDDAHLVYYSYLFICKGYGYVYNYKCIQLRHVPIMLLKLPIMHYGNAPEFCLLCSQLCSINA